MDAIAPTREWQQKFRYEGPKLDQKTDRKPYRKISQAEDLRRRDDITDAQFRAAEKLYKHHLGSMGVRVGQDETTDLSPDTEYPITYHNQKIAEARTIIRNAALWRDLMLFVTEQLSLVEIGTMAGKASTSIARAYALGRVQAALELMVDYWGLSTARQKVPRRA